MNKLDTIIRLERKEDQRAVECLVREAFWDVYRPGCLEHYVLHRMRSHPDFIPELSFVLLRGGELIGQNVFVRALIQADNGRKIPVAAMGPICIAPEYQRQGFGTVLLDASLERARAFGIKAVCFEGDIGFYGRSGFVCADSFGIRYAGLPEGADASFFLCKELEDGYLDGITGVYAPPECYLVAQEEAEAFDRAFPAKEKHRHSGQISG